ncbi:MAG: hypothetical protein HUJ65_05100, partial [Oscillospiraceae bacterium]|nr:hypothetical protein [Oscillospiraceae bacterium]
KAVEFEPDPIVDYASKFRPADAGIRGEIDYGDDMYYDYDREAPAEPADIEDKPAASAPADIGEGSFSETVNEDFEVSISYTDEIDDVVIDDDYFR